MEERQNQMADQVQASVSTKHKANKTWMVLFVLCFVLLGVSTTFAVLFFMDSQDVGDLEQQVNELTTQNQSLEKEKQNLSEQVGALSEEEVLPLDQVYKTDDYQVNYSTDYTLTQATDSIVWSRLEKDGEYIEIWNRDVLPDRPFGFGDTELSDEEIRAILPDVEMTVFLAAPIAFRMNYKTEQTREEFYKILETLVIPN